MKTKNLGIAVLLFAVFLSINSSGMELVKFSIAVIGFIIAIAENISSMRE